MECVENRQLHGEIQSFSKEDDSEKKKKGLSGSRTRDLSHPKRESSGHSISSSLPQGSHEIARRMRIISAFRALTRYSHEVSIRERKLFLLSSLCKFEPISCVESLTRHGWSGSGVRYKEQRRRRFSGHEHVSPRRINFHLGTTCQGFGDTNGNAG